jgi:hypothetical protein
MIPLDWLALFVFGAIGYCQLFLFYIHEYGVRGGWTHVLTEYNEKVKLLGLPGFILLIYFGITLGLKSTAVFLAWKAMNDSFGTLAYDESDMDFIGGTFIISTFAAIGWTKTFFTPPQTCFVPALFFSGVECIVSIIALPFYFSSGSQEVASVTQGESNIAAFVLQLLYIAVYSCLVTFFTFYGYFHVGDFVRTSV